MIFVLTLFSGKITAYEFKWKAKKKAKFPQKFIDAYQADVKVIDTNNYIDFIGEGCDWVAKRDKNAWSRVFSILNV